MEFSIIFQYFQPAHHQTYPVPSAVTRGSTCQVRHRLEWLQPCPMTLRAFLCLSVLAENRVRFNVHSLGKLGNLIASARKRCFAAMPYFASRFSTEAFPP